MFERGSERRRGSLRAKLLFSAGGTAALLLLIELAFRVLAPAFGIEKERLAEVRMLVVEGKIPTNEPRAYTGYVLSRSRPGVNQLGFWGWGDEIQFEKTPGVPRIACLGGSTTAGEAHLGPERAYPHYLDQILTDRSGRDVEVMNWGVGGWTSAETMINYFLNVQDYDPDIVILHHGVNDVDPRIRPGYQSNYSHFRRPWHLPDVHPIERLLTKWSDLFAAYELSKYRDFDARELITVPYDGPPVTRDGRPIPETAGAFRRNLRTVCEHVHARGGHPVLTTMPYDPVRGRKFKLARMGLEEHNDIVRELAREGGYLLVDLDEDCKAMGDEAHEIFRDLVHLIPQGDYGKAEKIAEALLKEGLLEAGEDHGPSESR